MISSGVDSRAGDGGQVPPPKKKKWNAGDINTDFFLSASWSWSRWRSLIMFTEEKLFVREVSSFNKMR